MISAIFLAFVYRIQQLHLAWKIFLILGVALIVLAIIAFISKRLRFRLSHTWPIRIKILELPTATFVYLGSRCYVEVKADFHLRIKPVMLKKYA